MYLNEENKSVKSRREKTPEEVAQYNAYQREYRKRNKEKFVQYRKNHVMKAVLKYLEERGY